MKCPIVKGKRFRYLYFTTADAVVIPVDDFRRALFAFIARCEELVFPRRVRLLFFDGSLGVVRCAHFDQHTVVAWLNRVLFILGEKQVGVQVQGVSGTMRALRWKYGLDKKE